MPTSRKAPSASSNATPTSSAARGASVSVFLASSACPVSSVSVASSAGASATQNVDHQILSTADDEGLQDGDYEGEDEEGRKSGDTAETDKAWKVTSMKQQLTWRDEMYTFLGKLYSTYLQRSG